MTSSNRISTEPDTDAVDPRDDLELVARCQTGDQDAFNQLVIRYRQRAFAMVYNMVRNEHDAWDLTQDGFLKAWKSIDRFRGQSSFYTWLYRILMNVGIDWMRRKHVQGASEFDDSLGMRNVEPAAATVPKSELAPLLKISDKEIRARIDEALLKLSPEHRAVIVLREIDGMDYQEIADSLECSIGTVMSRLFYARKKLQTILRDIYENL
ncbi:MAG: polymerase sigma factor RpoE [Chthoniobacteraceae bacterium]|nr:polymerase sigma factor RpoE [Chthoniobacteraceae bacterium]